MEHTKEQRLESSNPQSLSPMSMQLEQQISDMRETLVKLERNLQTALAAVDHIDHLLKAHRSRPPGNADSSPMMSPLLTSSPPSPMGIDSPPLPPLRGLKRSFPDLFPLSPPPVPDFPLPSPERASPPWGVEPLPRIEPPTPRQTKRLRVERYVPPLHYPLRAVTGCPDAHITAIARLMISQ